MTAHGMTKDTSLTPALLVAHVRYQVSRHGWPAVVGIALLVAALALQLWGVNQALAQAEKLGIEQAALRQRMAQRPLVVMEYLAPDRHNTAHRQAAALLNELGYASYAPAPDGQLDPCADLDAYLVQYDIESANFVFLKP